MLTTRFSLQHALILNNGTWRKREAVPADTQPFPAFPQGSRHVMQEVWWYRKAVQYNRGQGPGETQNTGLYNYKRNRECAGKTSAFISKGYGNSTGLGASTL